MKKAIETIYVVYPTDENTNRYPVTEFGTEEEAIEFGIKMGGNFCVGKRTRFEQEITGTLDKWVQEHGGDLKPDYWKKHAESEMAKAVERVKDMNIDEYGVATWKKSGNCVPDDILEMLEYAGVKGIDRKATKKAEARHIEEFLKTYRSEPDEE